MRICVEAGTDSARTVGGEQTCPVNRMTCIYYSRNIILLIALRMSSCLLPSRPCCARFLSAFPPIQALFALVPFPGSVRTKLFESYPALDVAVVAAQEQTLAHPLHAIDGFAGMALQLAHQFLLIEIVEAGAALLTADSQQVVLPSAKGHAHETFALDVAGEFAFEFEFVGGVCVDFLVVEVGKHQFLAL